MALDLRYNKVYITEADINGSRFYRVRIGTFHIKNDAFHFAKILLDEGYEVLITNYDEKM
jgi:cell division protein FtsN